MRLNITLLLVLITLSAFSQSRKGHIYLSGNTSLSAEQISAEQASFFRQVPVIIGSRFIENSDNDAFAWRAQSSRVGYFLTNRLMLGAELYFGSKITNGVDESNYFLNPFVRYYVTDRPGGEINFFAQLGFGTIGDFGFGSNYETNLHLGVGAEVRLTGDVAASALLRYNANAWGLNYTEFELRLNTFLGGGLGSSVGPALVRGSIMINPSIGRILLGHRGRDETLNLITDLNVSGGYFLHDRLVVEAGLTINTDQISSAGQFKHIETSSFIGARYLPTLAFRLRPYLLGRTHFTFAEVDRTLLNVSTNTQFEDVRVQSLLHLQAGGGVLVPLSDNVALDGEVLFAAPVSSEALREVRGRVGLKVFLPN